MSVDIRRFLTAFICSASVPAVALIAASSASADPVLPLPPPPPPDLAAVQTESAPAPGPLAPLNGVDIPAPASDAVDQAAGQLPTPPDGIPHLASPDALPPGSTMDPSVMGNEGPNVSYLKDLWHAVQNQEISGKEALLLGIAQRGMNTPVPSHVPGQDVPTSPADPAMAPPPPAPELPPLPPPPASPLPPPPASPLPPTPTE